MKLESLTGGDKFKIANTFSQALVKLANPILFEKFNPDHVIFERCQLNASDDSGHLYAINPDTEVVKA